MFAEKIIVTLFIVFVLIFEIVTADCNVVSKQQWDGMEPVEVSYLPRPVDLVIIQHTVTAPCNTDTKCKKIVQNIQNYHMGELNYPDIGPSFLVGGNGRIYEGSGWLHVGSHTYGYNRRSIGISFIGNYMETSPTQQMLNAVQALLKCGVDNGHLTSNYHVVGHRQLAATESPGIRVYNKIRTWPEWLEDVSSLKA